MSQQAAEYLEGKVCAAIDYCRKEFDITYMEVIGVLHILADTMVREMRDVECEEEEE